MNKLQNKQLSYSDIPLILKELVVRDQQVTFYVKGEHEANAICGVICGNLHELELMVETEQVLVSRGHLHTWSFTFEDKLRYTLVKTFDSVEKGCAITFTPNYLEPDFEAYMAEYYPEGYGNPQPTLK